MYTRCTDCRTLFRITREQLNAARGQVRCGRCGNVFDALASLEEELVAPETAPRVEEIFAQRAEDGSEANRAGVAPEVSDDDDGPAPADARTVFPREPTFVIEGVREPRRRGRAAWLSVAFLLSVALALQLVHMNRETLARNPDFEPYLSMAYGWLGMRLETEPRYDLAAFALLHHELVTHPRDDRALHLSGVLTNTADFAQPWPVLELRLEDRFGEVVAARRLHPGEYLRNPPARDEPMPANARRAIEVEFVDPGHDAVGFTVEFCVRIRDGLRCTSR